MFILSQDKKKLAEYKKIYVSNQYNGKKSKKASLLGVGTGIFVFSEGAVVLDEYETQEETITAVMITPISPSNTTRSMPCRTPI